MYQLQPPPGVDPTAAEARSAGSRRPQVARNVWILGLTSLLTDASSEMVAAVLPLYALYFLRMSPLAFGLIDGLQQGGASLVKLGAGWLTDRSGRHKTVAAAGYAASAVSRLGLLFTASGAVLLTPMVVLDRLGKGIRTAPRDALISLSVSRATLATAFGVHRALDTVGAMLGPLLAFAVLYFIRDGYDVVFVISLALAVIGVAVLITFVETPAVIRDAAANAASRALQRWPARFIRIAASAAILGIASVSDSFIYLSLQTKLGFSANLLPLLYVFTPAVYLTLAAPAGRLADQVGRAWVIVGGYAMLFAVYVVLSLNLSATISAALAVGLLGTFYAATDGVFAAFAAGELPVERRATGLAIVSAGNDVGRMLASLAFGWFWTHGATATALSRFQIALPVALAVSVILLWPLLTESKTHAS